MNTLSYFHRPFLIFVFNIFNVVFATFKFKKLFYRLLFRGKSFARNVLSKFAFGPFEVNLGAKIHLSFTVYIAGFALFSCFPSLINFERHVLMSVLRLAVSVKQISVTPGNFCYIFQLKKMLITYFKRLRDLLEKSHNLQVWILIKSLQYSGLHTEKIVRS